MSWSDFSAGAVVRETGVMAIGLPRPHARVVADATMRNRNLDKILRACVVAASLLAVPAAQADPRSEYVTALVAGASTQRDVQAAEAGFAAARQARSQLEASLRAATVAEIAPLAARVEALRRRPAIEPETGQSDTLAARVEVLRARPEIRPDEIPPDPRIEAINAELAGHAQRRAELEQDRRRHVVARMAAERDAERATAIVERSARDLDRARERVDVAGAFLRRFDAPDPDLRAQIRAEARPRARRALEGDPMDALFIALQRLRNSAATFRAESTERGTATFSNVPAGRAVFVGGGFIEQVMATEPDAIDALALPTLAISKSGDYVLARQDREALSAIVRGAEARSAGGAGEYDACLLRGLAGASSDVAARAVIGACRALHPASARHDIVLRFDEIRRLEEAYLFVGPAVAGLAEALRQFSAEAARAQEDALAAIAAETRQDSHRRVESLQREVAGVEQRLQVERAAQSGAQETLVAARATEAGAELRLAAYLATGAESALRDERATRAAAAQAATDAAAAAAAAETVRMAAELDAARRDLDAALDAAARAATDANAKQGAELAQAQRALAAASEARRQADAQRLRPLADVETEAQQRLARATAAATSGAVAAAAAKRSGFLAHLAREGLERQFRGSVRLDLRYSSVAEMCIAFANPGRFAIANPNFELLFRGRSIQELGIKSSEFIPLYDRYSRVAFTYENQYGEPVQGMRAGASSSPECNFIMRVDGDHGRIFERVGGSIASWRDPSNWSVRVSGQLSLPGDVQEWRDAYSSQRRWRHVPTPTERLFAAELAAAEAEAHAQIVKGAATRSDPVETPGAPPPAASSTAVARPGAADPAGQEAALGLDPTRIREIQRRLTSLGHDTRGADGKLGPGSRAAIASFQRAHGRPATGFIGPSDLNSLGIAR
jgi:hypothetical protein